MKKSNPLWSVALACVVLFSIGTLLPGPNHAPGSAPVAMPSTPPGPPPSASQWFASLTPTSQAALIGSGTTLVAGFLAAMVALATNYLTHWGSERRLHVQLDHDREARRVQREMDVRKSVYLDAADSVSAGIVSLMRLGSITLTTDQALEEFNEKRGAIAKCHLIASDEALIAILDVIDELAVAITRFSIRRAPVLALKGRLDDKISMRTRHLADRDKLITAINDLTPPTSPHDEARLKFLQSMFEYSGREFEAAHLDADDFQWQLANAHANLLEEIQAAALTINIKTMVVVKTARDDLELPFDFELYQSKGKRNLQDVDREIQSAIASLRQQAADKQAQVERQRLSQQRA